MLHARTFCQIHLCLFQVDDGNTDKEVPSLHVTGKSRDGQGAPAEAFLGTLVRHTELLHLAWGEVTAI